MNARREGRSLQPVSGATPARPAAASAVASPLSSASRPRSAHDLVTQGIGRGIVQGEFGIGSTLPNDAELMDRFGVSRTALREGMKTLAAKGLIESKTKVGTRVLPEKNWNMFDADILSWRVQLGVDRDFLGNLFAIRQAVEPLAAASAALSRTEGDIALIAAAWDEMRKCRDRDGFTRADLDFHRAVLDASGNPFLQSMGSVIEAALATAFAISAPGDDPKLLDRSSRQHRDILEAIVAGDAQGASEAMSAVILQGARGAEIDHPGAPCVSIAIQLF